MQEKARRMLILYFNYKLDVVIKYILKIKK